jgi:hypothetical protein
LLNLAGIIMAALGRFPYAENHLGALVLGNLLMAILMRNELWFRFMYLVAIYGLRSVSSCSLVKGRSLTMGSSVGTNTGQARSDVCSAARWRYSFGVCSLRCWVS